MHELSLGELAVFFGHFAGEREFGSSRLTRTPWANLPSFPLTIAQCCLLSFADLGYAVVNRDDNIEW